MGRLGGAALPNLTLTPTLAPNLPLPLTLTLALLLTLTLTQARLFLELCILSGCDYLPHLRGLAINTAHRLLCAHRNVEHVVKVRVRVRVRVGVVKVSDATLTPPRPHGP